MGATPTKFGLGWAPIPLATSGSEPWLQTPYVPRQGTISHGRGFKPDVACYITGYADEFTRREEDFARRNGENNSLPAVRETSPEFNSQMLSEGWIAFDHNNVCNWHKEPYENTYYTWYYRPWEMRVAKKLNNRINTDDWIDYHSPTSPCAA